ncbi:MAG: sensor histidine kinase [Pedobacter sp.]|nr:MAG: sensor histidine kinase [Pedobacter sp.]
MKIKDRLALYFTSISTLVLLCVLFGVYLTFKSFMKAEFFVRLTDRTMVTAKLYLEADEISAKSLDKVRAQYLIKLNSEVTRIYDSRNTATFIGDNQQYWTSGTIDKVRKNKKLQYMDGDRQVVGIYYKDNQGDFVILASAIDYGTITRLDKLRKIMFAAFVVIFISLLLSARWMAMRVLRPLNSFIEEVKHITPANLQLRVKENQTKDELYFLAQNFNTLMEHLENAFVLQKTFVANASHELRTPITRLMITADLALKQKRSTEQYEQSLRSILEDADNLEKIIESLLTLAQTDLENATKTNLPKIRIDEIIWTLKDEWTTKAGINNFILHIDEFPDDENLFIIYCNPTLLKIALDNVISNAYKFSDHQPVDCLLSVTNEGIKINISDSGIGVEASLVDSIFKPFFSSSSGDKHTGNGMGLYMASKIINLYGGKIEVSPNKEVGSTFSILFPRF